MERQLRKLGFSLDWSRMKFTLDEDVVKVVSQTFKKMYDDSLIYRAERLVNYCTFDGTSFSDLEVVYQERQNPLYYIKYGSLVLATTRPETKFETLVLRFIQLTRDTRSISGRKLKLRQFWVKQK